MVRLQGYMTNYIFYHMYSKWRIISSVANVMCSSDFNVYKFLYKRKLPVRVKLTKMDLISASPAALMALTMTLVQEQNTRSFPTNISLRILFCLLVNILSKVFETCEKLNIFKTSYSLFVRVIFY